MNISDNVAFVPGFGTGSSRINKSNVKKVGGGGYVSPLPFSQPSAFTTSVAKPSDTGLYAVF